VIHSFFVPALRIKMDALPGRYTQTWFNADRPGRYEIFCAEYCGLSHSGMRGELVVMPAEEFDTWLAHMKSLGPKPPAAAAGAPAAGGDSLRTASAGARVRSAAQDTAAASPPAQGAEYAAGEKLFLTKGCMGCHSLQAANAPKGLIGPNLANVGSRAYIAAGWLANTDENLERWIREPQAVKKGVLMPNLGVTVEEARALRAYLRAHQ